MQPGSEEPPHATAWESFAGALAEGGWLASVILVAIFFNTDTARIFEEDKVFLFRSVALVVTVALGVWVLEGRHGLSIRAVWQRPLVKPVVALGAAYLISAPFSIAPRVSFWGGYERAQGAYTWLCYVAVFVAIVAIIRRRAQIERLVTTILLASLPLALYGIVQKLGADPIEWDAVSFPRVHSMAGNSIFLAAVLLIVIPLTLAALLQRWSLLRRGHVARHAPLLLAYLALLFVQILAIVYSQSRGPFLGLCAGLAVFLLAFAVCTGRRWVSLATAVMTAAGVCFLVVFNLPDSPLAPLRNVQYVGRLGQLSSGSWSSASVRILVWEGVVDLLAAEPQRLVFGYGPDTLRFVFPRVRPERMSYHDRRDVVADRSHNETFDAIVMTGIVGVVAELILFVSLFFWITRWLGLLRSRPQRNAFFGLILGGASLGFAGALAIDGSFRFAGVALPLGMVVGLFVYLLAASIARFGADVRLDRDRLLLVALLAAIVGHFVEVQVGIAVVATRHYFFVCAALALVVGTWREQGDEASENGPVVGGSLAPLAPLVGLILVLLTYDFYRLDLDLQLHGKTLGGLLAAVWFFGLLLVASDSRASEGVIERVVSFATTSLGIWILFLAIYLPRASTRALVKVGPTIAEVAASASRPLQAVTILYAFVLVVLLFYAGITCLREKSVARRQRSSLMRAPVYAGLLVMACAIALHTNLQRSWADVLAAQGALYQAAGAWRTAALAYAEAEQGAPGEDIYPSQLGFALLEQAKRRGELEWEPRHGLLRDAQTALLRARRLNPANLDHMRNLAKLHGTWAEYDPDVGQARQHLKDAESIYRRLTIAMPRNAGLMNEWATLYLDHGDMQNALARLDDSLRIDDSYYTTHWLRGNALMQTGAFQDALAAYDRTLRLSPHLPAAMSAKALALAALGRLDEAVRVTRQAVHRDAADLISRRNLISLLLESGDRRDALKQARAALPHAKGDDALQFRELIAQLEAEDGGQGSGDGSSDP
jgi:O-antigen ligase/tetratricopeptide (TPR) repeat protein